MYRCGGECRGEGLDSGGVAVALQVVKDKDLSFWTEILIINKLIFDLIYIKAVSLTMHLFKLENLRRCRLITSVASHLRGGGEE